jgi:signal transduction histidine kinase
MGSRLADSILGDRAILRRIHMRVVRVGAISAGAVTLLFLALALFTGDGVLLLDAIGPALAGAFMTSMVLLRREHGGVALVGSAVVVVTMSAAVGDESNLLATAVALVVVSALGVLFVEKRVVLVVGAVGLGLFLVPLLWSLDVDEGLVLGSIMALSFVTTAIILLALRGAATTVSRRHRMLFADSPTAVMEEDWSEGLDYVRSEYAGAPGQIRPFLLAYPAVVRRAVSRTRIVRVNQAAIDLLEASGEGDLLGYRDGSKVIEASLEAFVDVIVALYEGRPIFESEIFGLTLRGSPIWLQARCANVSRDRDADTVLVGLSDVTLMKTQQDAMAELVRAKDEFIAKVSHELRTPLTAVLGLTSAMNSAESLSDEERAELMGMVATQAAEMSYIVDDLLVAARAEMDAVTIVLETVDPRAEAVKVLDNLALGAIEVPDEMPKVIADPGRLRQIFRNLLTNANRYGGDRRRILAGVEDGSVWIEVRDDGEGVNPEDTDRIFEPYATAHSGVTGSVGLGLSVARQLAELMGGSLAYDRDRSETVFRLQLPLAREPVGVTSHT